MEAPLAEIVVEEPTQIVAVPLAKTVIDGFTVITTTLMAVHPAPSVPVTVYVVVLPGETV